MDSWSVADRNREIVFDVINAVDWAQTRYIAKHSNQFEELNPILGKHPSISQVNWYFLSETIGHSLVTYAIPARWRPFWQGMTIGVELETTVHNARIGIRMEF